MAENVTVILLLSMVVLGMLLFFTADKMRHIGDAIVVALIYVCIVFFLTYGFGFYNTIESKVCFNVQTDELKHYPNTDKLEQLSISDFIAKNDYNLSRIKNITLDFAKKIALDFDSFKDYYEIKDQKNIDLFKDYYSFLLTSMKEAEERPNNINDFYIKEFGLIRKGFDLRVCNFKKSR
ncbi:hypothetical protein [Campylobacter sp. RM12651]|uniref:hypothetical protein n=1 Tax=Campylobacter sp. RM12651 TaxID=1660079 RepID=UPI001EFA2D72|nr:hypothetical protein [Campylobacter sp. RM12651]ULO04534.1 putative membrane protein [Campylobacter sp. RM12651]